MPVPVGDKIRVNLQWTIRTGILLSCGQVTSCWTCGSYISSPPVNDTCLQERNIEQSCFFHHWPLHQVGLAPINHNSVAGGFMGPKTRSMCGLFKVLSVQTAVKVPASVSSQAVFGLCVSVTEQRTSRETACQSSGENLQVPLHTRLQIQSQQGSFI